jgi:hypothetical protein
MTGLGEYLPEYLYLLYLTSSRGIPQGEYLKGNTSRGIPPGIPPYSTSSRGIPQGEYLKGNTSRGIPPGIPHLFKGNTSRGIPQGEYLPEYLYLFKGNTGSHHSRQLNLET